MHSLIKTVLLAAAGAIAAASAQAAPGDRIVAAAQATEKALGARVGVAVIDMADGASWTYKARERFPMASTFKGLACGALLAAGADVKARSVVIQKQELVPYSPVTETLVGKEVAAVDLCKATLRTSDNTAANKVLDILGGPAKVTAFLRESGDDITRLDRREPELNEGKPGDDRDTTTPLAVATTMRNLILGDILKESDRAQLTEWLVANEVGGPLLRAGVPSDWRIADRTGGGGFGTRGVVAVMWPAQGEPIVAAVYITETTATMDERNKAIAEIGRAIATEANEYRSN